MPARPTVTAAIAFSSDPGATPVWTDVTAYLQAFSLRRGRSYELGAVPAGTLTLTLDNRDRRFDPTWTGGPYGANVKLRRRCRIQATWSSVTYDLIHAYIAAFRPRIAPHNGDAEMVIDAADGFKTLSMQTVSGSFAAERTDIRIGAVLNAAGWLAADRDLGTGLITTQAVTLNGAGALDHLQRIVDDEAGFLWINRSGQVAFRNRYVRLDPTLVALVTLGDGGGSEQLYPDVEFSFDDQHVANEVRVTRDGGTTQVISDSASQQQYLRRTLVLSGTLHSQDGDAYGLANYLLAVRRQPKLRVGRVEIDADIAPATMWPHVLGRELGDRILLRRRPPGGGTIEQYLHLEGVQIDWTAEGGEWRVAWELSPADTTQYWRLGDSTYSVLGSTTRLAP
jgi:hypothetical protein